MRTGSRFLGRNVIITPHLGEMSRLLGSSIGEIQEKLIRTAVNYAKETGAICVLKDACTVVADETGETCLNLSGNAGMATAGSGDVLSGVLAGDSLYVSFSREETVTGSDCCAGCLCSRSSGR